MAFINGLPIASSSSSSQFHGTPLSTSKIWSHSSRTFTSSSSSSSRASIKMTIAEPAGGAAKALETRALEIFMPALSSTMETGRIVQWLKSPGEYIKKGEAVMVVESDKADMDVESFETGYLAAVLVEEGGECNVGETVALLAATEDQIESVKECNTACIVSGSGSRHDGTTAVDTPTAPPPTPAPAAAPAAPASSNGASILPKPKFGEVFMPALSSTMETGKVVDWLKSEGDRVNKGDMVMVVESDKADMDVESFEEGYLAHILIQPGDECPVGEAVGYLAPTEDDIPAVKEWAISQGDPSQLAQSNGVAVSTPAATAVPAAAAPAVAETPVVVNEGRVVASPYAKKVAKELGVDLRVIKGTGPNGGIVERDVRNAAEASVNVTLKDAAFKSSKKMVATPEAKKLAKKEGIKLEGLVGTGNFGRITGNDVLKAAGKVPAPKQKVAPVAASSEKASAPAEKKPIPDGAVAMNGMQKAVVKNMNASLEVPAFRASYTIRTAAFDALYGKLKPKGVSVSAMLAKAVALTLAKHPIMNAAYAPDSIVYRKDIHIGMAVSLPDGGLITPVLKNADTTDIYSLGRTWRDLVRRAMDKKLSPDEYTTGSFFISNMGMFGVDAFDAILPPGAPGILAIGASKPVVAAQTTGLVQVEKQMTVNVTCDHRHIYGADAGEFLKDLCDLIENNTMDLLI